MTKEMYVSSTPHESKVAIVEDDQLAEIFYERENEYTLAGSIYKGRVTRVLPGMQSAFVDIGLERDAFLYVSDFLDLGEGEEEEFEEIPVRPEAYVTNRPQPEARTYGFQKEFRTPEPAVNQEVPDTGGEESAEDVYTGASDTGREDNEAATEENDREYRGGRRRRRGRRGRGFPESKFTHPERESSRPEMPIAEDFRPPVGYAPIVLPGESISKYRRGGDQLGQRSETAIRADRGESTPTEDQAGSGTEPFVIEGGFEDDAAQKQFAEPEAPVQPVVAPEALKSEPETRAVLKPAKMPFILPGESIAKYRQPAKSATSEPAMAQGPEAIPADENKLETEQAVAERVIAEKAGETPAPELAQPPVPPPFVPAVLPGESIAKYQSRPEAPGEAAAVEGVETGLAASRGEEGRRKSRQDEPRTEVRVERRSPVAPFVLPGESIAKYRRVAEPVGSEEEHARQLQQQIETQPEEELAQEASELISDNEPLSATLERESAQEAMPTLPAHQEGDEAQAGLDEAEKAVGASGDDTQGIDDQHEDATVEPRYEQMNVASTFGGEAVESEPDAEEAAFHSHAETQEPESAEERHGYSAEAGHTLEQEELDEEEADYVLSEDDEEGDYVEMEEQTYEPGSLQRNFGSEARRFAEGEEIDEANGLTDALHDAIVDEETTHAAYPQDTAVDHEGIEIETPEDLAETDEEFEEAEMQANGSMGTAGAQGTPGAGYPQRGPRPYDHRQRGRRGGRRMNNRPRREPRQVPLISELLKEGQEVLIQIAKEPIGKKGARITSHIALPGRYLVYMPTVNHIGVSRKISSEEERQRLKRIMISEREGGHGGFIVRTAAEGITEEELRADIRFLKNLWADIRQRSDNSKAPALIYHDLNLVERVLRDQVTADFSAIWVDTEQEYERILRFANRFQPQLVRKVKLYTKSTPLYEQFGIQAEIDKALKSKVWLKSGGYIVINQTEALVAIDINTGKYVGKTARLEDTIVKTNVDAIKEIVRQVRLRDLGGIIVIDFIDMDERKNRQKVMQALEEALKSDRAPSKVLQFNDFGLVAITRKRVKQSLERTLGEPCPYCTGTGLVKSLTTMCNEIYIEMRKMAAHAERGDIMLRVNPEIAKALKAGGGKWIQEMEELTQKTIILKSDPLLHQEHFDIEA